MIPLLKGLHVVAYKASPMLLSPTSLTQKVKKPSVLVTGAAGGTQGATGRVLAERLLKRGVAVRAFVRTDDERAASLRAAGAEVSRPHGSQH